MTGPAAGGRRPRRAVTGRESTGRASRRSASLPAVVGLAALLAGCAGGPPAPSAAPGATSPAAADVVMHALGLVGVPYRYGGRTPETGFDCSGLVWYTHRRAGLDVPRTARAQHAAATPVTAERLRPGDLLFFGRRRIAHVAIYVGDGRFVHAPAAGRSVETGRLTDDWYAANYVGAGRLAP